MSLKNEYMTELTDAARELTEFSDALRIKLEKFRY
jgi:hypothetical protein